MLKLQQQHKVQQEEQASKISKQLATPKKDIDSSIVVEGQPVVCTILKLRQATLHVEARHSLLIKPTQF